MKCHNCKEDKLSEEFPFYAPSENCDHALLHCLKCVTKEIQQHKRCSQCQTQVDLNSRRYNEYIEMLEFLFPVPKVQNVVQQGSPEGRSCITVTNMSGERTNPMEYRPTITVQALMERVNADMKIPCDQQILLYNGVELKPARKENWKSVLFKEVFNRNQFFGRHLYEKDLYKQQNCCDYRNKLISERDNKTFTRKTNGLIGQGLTIGDYNVLPGSTIHLLVRLYDVPEELDEVILDLSWGFPGNDPDYLDATVFLYNGKNLCETVDYKFRCDKSRYGSAVKHSGDETNEFRKMCHHKIEVSLKSLPPEIDKLVFTLSSWNAPNISEFRNPAFRFYNKNSPDVQLCRDAMDHGAHSRAIIMCCLSKREGRWEVRQLKKPADGNAQDYGPLKHKILSFIRQGYI